MDVRQFFQSLPKVIFPQIIKTNFRRLILKELAVSFRLILNSVYAAAPTISANVLPRGDFNLKEICFGVVYYFGVRFY